MVERVGAFPRPHGVDRGAAESSAAASSVVVNSAAASSVVVNSVENLRRRLNDGGFTRQAFENR